MYEYMKAQYAINNQVMKRDMRYPNMLVDKNSLIYFYRKLNIPFKSYRECFWSSLEWLNLPIYSLIRNIDASNVVNFPDDPKLTFEYLTNILQEVKN